MDEWETPFSSSNEIDTWDTSGAGSLPEHPQW